MFVSESVSISLSVSTNFTKARSAAGSIFALINRIPKIDSFSDSGSRASSSSVRGEITFEGVHFSYPTRPDTQVLRGLDLVIRPNRVTALVGASGCGKSSCVGLIQRWYDPLKGMYFSLTLPFYSHHAGSVKLDGQDIREYNIRNLRATIGLVGAFCY